MRSKQLSLRSRKPKLPNHRRDIVLSPSGQGQGNQSVASLLRRGGCFDGGGDAFFGDEVAEAVAAEEQIVAILERDMVDVEPQFLGIGQIVSWTAPLLYEFVL